MIVVPGRDERADDLVQLLASRRALSAAVGSSITISCASRDERAQDLDLLLLGGAQPAGRRRAPGARTPPRAASSS